MLSTLARKQMSAAFGLLKQSAPGYRTFVYFIESHVPWKKSLIVNRKKETNLTY